MTPRRGPAPRDRVGPGRESSSSGKHVRTFGTDRLRCRWHLVRPGIVTLPVTESADRRLNTSDQIRAPSRGILTPTRGLEARRASSVRSPLIRRCCSQPQSPLPSVRLYACGPPIALSYSVKNSVKGGHRRRCAPDRIARDGPGSRVPGCSNPPDGPGASSRAGRQALNAAVVTLGTLRLGHAHRQRDQLAGISGVACTIYAPPGSI